MADKIDMRKVTIKSIDALISEGSRIDEVKLERDWKEVYNPAQPWIPKRERSGYAGITIKFVPTEKKDEKKVKKAK